MVDIAFTGFYVYGAFGNTDSEITLGGLNRVVDDNSSYAIGAGYALNHNISLEGAYLDFGSHFGETNCPPDFTCLVVPVSASGTNFDQFDWDDKSTGMLIRFVGTHEQYDKIGDIEHI